VPPRGAGALVDDERHPGRAPRPPEARRAIVRDAALLGAPVGTARPQRAGLAVTKLAPPGNGDDAMAGPRARRRPYRLIEEPKPRRKSTSRPGERGVEQFKNVVPAKQGPTHP